MRREPRLRPLAETFATWYVFTHAVLFQYMPGLEVVVSTCDECMWMSLKSCAFLLFAAMLDVVVSAERGSRAHGHRLCVRSGVGTR